MLKSRVDALEGLSSSGRARTSRLTGSSDINSLQSGKYMDSGAVSSDNSLSLGAADSISDSALQSTVQRLLQAELQSEAFRGTETIINITINNSI